VTIERKFKIEPTPTEATVREEDALGIEMLERMLNEFDELFAQEK